MTPLLFAAAVALSGPGAKPFDQAQISPSLQKRLDAEKACARLGIQTVAPDGTPMLKKLGELPPALLEHAIWRSVAGCPVREIVWKGQTYYISPGAEPGLDRAPLRGRRLTRPDHSLPPDATPDREGKTP